MWRSSVHVGRCGWSPRGSHDLLSRMCVSEKGGAGPVADVEISMRHPALSVLRRAFFGGFCLFRVDQTLYLHLVRGKWRVTYPPPPPGAVRSWRANDMPFSTVVATRSGRTRRDPRTVDAATRSRRRRRSPTTAVRGPYRYRKTERRTGRPPAEISGGFGSVRLCGWTSPGFFSLKLCPPVDLSAFDD